MQYDPIKNTLGNFFNRSPFYRKVFYRLLDLLLLRAWHIQRELNKWSKEVSNKAHILDAGSGFGQYTYWLSSKNRNWNILAVDVKQEQVCDCNKFFNTIKRENVLFKVEDLVTYKRDQAFDLILSVDVMEHIEEDVQVFENFHHSLKPGGMLLISTPSDQGGSDVHGDDEQSFIEEHVRDGYNKQEIKDKLKSAGFSKVKVHYSYGNPGKISWRLSMKYPLLMLNVSKLFFILIPFYYLLVFPFCLVLNYIDTHSAHSSGTGLIVKAWK
jgi:2-polyprenyl-3-methyl-5-hydroxy-6-metoxy-1,4-benzoquinol methylase